MCATPRPAMARLPTTRSTDAPPPPPEGPGWPRMLADLRSSKHTGAYGNVCSYAQDHPPQHRRCVATGAVSKAKPRRHALCAEAHPGSSQRTITHPQTRSQLSHALLINHPLALPTRRRAHRDRRRPTRGVRDTAVSDDPARALDLYSWNAAVSAALFEDLSVLEVTLRNACHRELRAWNAAQGQASPWYHHPVLTPGGMHQALLDLLDWIDRDIRHWVITYSRVPALLQNRP